MPIPKPSQTKQPILNYLTKVGRPVNKAVMTEDIGKRFNLTKNEMEETSLKGSKRFAMSINASIKEMKAAGLIRSFYGLLEITPKGRGWFAGSPTQAGTSTNGRRKPGRPPKAQAKAPINGRRKPGRPPKVQTGALTGVRGGSGSPPKAQIGATNGRRKPGRPKVQPAMQYSASRQPSASPAKRDDKLVQMAADIVVSYVGKNTVPANQIPSIIHSTYAALARLGN